RPARRHCRAVFLERSAAAAGVSARPWAVAGNAGLVGRAGGAGIAGASYRRGCGRAALWAGRQVDGAGRAPLAAPWPGVGRLAGLVALGLLGRLIGGDAAWLLYGLSAMWLGLAAPGLRRHGLQWRGWRYRGPLIADSRDLAQLQAVENRP